MVDQCFEENLLSIWSCATEVGGLCKGWSSLSTGKKRKDWPALQCNIICRAESVKRIQDYMAETLEISCIRTSVEGNHLEIVPNTEEYPEEGTSMRSQYAKKLFEKMRLRIPVSEEKVFADSYE